MDAIASAVLSSKVDKLTKGFENAVGLNEDGGDSEVMVITPLEMCLL